MIKVRFEPHYIDIFHRIKLGDGVTKLNAGTILMKDATDPSVVKASTGSAVWGVLSQDVYVRPGNEYALPYNDHRAYDGDFVGIYHEGMFETDQFETGTYTPGATVYVSNNGKFTASSGNVAVGKVVRKDSNTLFVKLG
jgi:predicted RecA/RadA family phage recombinase